MSTFDHVLPMVPSLAAGVNAAMQARSQALAEQAFGYRQQHEAEQFGLQRGELDFRHQDLDFRRNQAEIERLLDWERLYVAQDEAARRGQADVAHQHQQADELAFARQRWQHGVDQDLQASAALGAAADSIFGGEPGGFQGPGHPLRPETPAVRAFAGLGQSLRGMNPRDGRMILGDAMDQLTQVRKMDAQNEVRQQQEQKVREFYQRRIDALWDLHLEGKMSAEDLQKNLRRTGDASDAALVSVRMNKMPDFEGVGGGRLEIEQEKLGLRRQEERRRLLTARAGGIEREYQMLARGLSPLTDTEELARLRREYTGRMRAANEAIERFESDPAAEPDGPDVDGASPPTSARFLSGQEAPDGKIVARLASGLSVALSDEEYQDLAAPIVANAKKRGVPITIEQVDQLILQQLELLGHGEGSPPPAKR